MELFASEDQWQWNGEGGKMIGALLQREDESRTSLPP